MICKPTISPGRFLPSNIAGQFILPDPRTKRCRPEQRMRWLKALRTAQHMSMAELARRASMSDRAIRYIESNQREPSVDAIQKIAAALGVTTDYFMDEATFQQELNDDLFYADVRKKYGSRGVAQAKKIKEQTTALFAGGELSEEDQAAFIKEMEALFLDAKADAKKFTPKKYLR